MTLSLPADVELFADDYDQLRTPGVYCLTLTAPEDVTTAWEAHFEHRPPWVDHVAMADAVYYVGAAKDVLARLEDHRDGEVRKASILRVCSIDGLRNVWWYDSADEAFIRESAITIQMQNEYPNAYVHSR